LTPENKQDNIISKDFSNSRKKFEKNFGVFHKNFQDKILTTIALRNLPLDDFEQEEDNLC